MLRFQFAFFAYLRFIHAGQRRNWRARCISFAVFVSKVYTPPTDSRIQLVILCINGRQKPNKQSNAVRHPLEYVFARFDGNRICFDALKKSHANYKHGIIITLCQFSLFVISSSSLCHSESLRHKRCKLAGDRVTLDRRCILSMW